MYWAIRTLWLVTLGAGVVWAAETPLPRLLLWAGAGALLVQALMLVLIWLRRVPPWHDWLWTMASASLGLVAIALFPEWLPLLLLLSLLPLLDLARWRGWSSVVMLLVFPLPALAYLYLRSGLGMANVPLVAGWAIVALLGIGLAASPTRRDTLAEPALDEGQPTSEAFVAKVAQLLVRESKYERILEVLVRGGCELLDQGSPRSQAKGMALTFKPGLYDTLVIKAHYNLEQPYLTQSYELTGVLEVLMQEGEPAESSAEQPPFDRIGALKDHQLLLFPLRTGMDVYGAVVFATRDTRRAQNEEIQRTLIALADQGSLAIHNAVLQQQLSQDRLQQLDGEGGARHQLARDLHDGPVQRVAAISMQLELLKALMKRQPDQALAELEQLQEVAKLAAQEMRTMLFSLRPVVLESDGLAAALDTFVARLREQDKLQIELEVEALPRLDDKVEEVAFAILQEAINNAKKYAGNTPIRVRLLKGQEMVICQVQDKGPGFDLKAITSSYGTRASLGLLNMQERAAMVGGILKIDTAPNKGTTVSLAVPFELG